MKKDNLSLYNEFINGVTESKIQEEKEKNKKIFYFGYCRKSTESDERQIQSIESQITWLSGVLGDNFKDLKLYQESKSAKAPDNREEFKKLKLEIENISKKFKGKINFEIHLYTWGLDRLSRNPVDSGILQYMLQVGEINKIICSDRVFTTIDSGILMSLFNAINNQFIMDLRKNVKRGMKDKADKGGCIQRVPNGYLNNLISKEADVDPKIAPIIIEIFNLRDKGYSYNEIAKICKERGYNTRNGNYFSKSTIEQIIKNPFYIGLQRSNGILKKGLHKRLIKVDLWERVNELKRGYVKKDKEKLFPLKGIIKNYHTGKPLLALMKKGKYVYYSTHSSEDIIINMNQNHIISAFDKIIEHYIIPEKFKDFLLEMIKKNFSEQFKKLENERNSLNLKIKELNKKSSKIFELVCDGIIPNEKYSEENNKIVIEKEKYNDELTRLGKKDLILNEESLKIVELLVSLNSMRKTLNNNSKALLIKNIVVELKIDNKKQLYIQENELFELIKILNGLGWQGVKELHLRLLGSESKHFSN